MSAWRINSATFGFGFGCRHGLVLLQISMQTSSAIAVKSIFNDVHPLLGIMFDTFFLETVVSLSHFLIVVECGEGKPFSRILLFSLCFAFSCRDYENLSKGVSGGIFTVELLKVIKINIFVFKSILDILRETLKINYNYFFKRKAEGDFLRTNSFAQLDCELRKKTNSFSLNFHCVVVQKKEGKHIFAYWINWKYRTESSYQALQHHLGKTKWKCFLSEGWKCSRKEDRRGGGGNFFIYYQHTINMFTGGGGIDLSNLGSHMEVVTSLSSSCCLRKIGGNCDVSALKTKPFSRSSKQRQRL